MARRLKAPSPALVVAMIALFVSIGGVGYAASKIDTNDIKSQAVTKPKLAKKAVATGKLDGQAVKTGKIAGQAIKGGKIADIQVRAADLGALTVRQETTPIAPNGGTAFNFVDCSPGQVRISGGVSSTGLNSQTITNQPTDGNGWVGLMRNNTAQQQMMTVTALCLQE
jgi:hypothetical protein